MTKIKTLKLQTRASFDVATFNDDDRTVEIVFATDTPVLRYDWMSGAYFNEVLSFKKDHVRLDRLNSGAQVLDNHQRYGSVREAVIGVIEKAWIADGQGRAKIRFSSREDVQPLVKDVKEGIQRSISFGYKVYEYEKEPAVEGETPTYRAIDWEPNEISFVTVPADPVADLRSAQERSASDYYEANIRNSDNNNNSHDRTMLTKEEQAALDAERKRASEITKAVEDAKLPGDFARKLIDDGTTVDKVAGLITAEQARIAAAPKPADEKTITAAERKRSEDIIAAVETAKLPSEFARSLISEGVTIDVARQRIIEKWATNDPNAGARGTVEVGADREANMVRQASEAALVLRVMPEAGRANGTNPAVYSEDVVKESRKYRGLTLLDMAKASLVRSGMNIDGLDKMEIVGRAFTSSTSDFPVLLEGTNRRVLLASYQAAADTWRRFCAVGSVSDFREYKRLRMGTFNDLDAVLENGEFKTKKITDADYEKVSIDTKGNLINVSRKMIINDDLGAFTKLAGMLGRAAARSIENDVYALFALNSGNGPLLVDGLPLFHTDHGNISTDAGAPIVTRIDSMRQQMAKQMDKDSNDYLDIRPSLALSPLSLGSTLRVLNTSQYDPDAANKLQRPNIVNGMFSDVIDTPRLSGTAYYLLSSISDEPVFEVNFLDGQQTPYMESMNGFTVDGVQWKIRHDYGVDAIGHRGIIKNTG